MKEKPGFYKLKKQTFLRRFMKSKIVSAILILTVIFSIAASLTGCKSETADGKSGDLNENATNSPDAETAEETEVNYLETLPVENFDGYTFKIIAQHYDARPNFPSEEETGEPMNDNLLRRNRQIEERFNIKIENIAFEDRGQVRDRVTKSVKAQDNAYDMVITSMADGINTLAPGGSLYNLSGVNYVDLESDWWCRSMYEDMQIDGKIFYTTGALSPFFYYTPVVFVYNKKLALDYDIGDMNKLVLNNEWTADKLVELVKDRNQDIDGDGKITKSDFFGLSHDGGVTGQALFTAFGQKMTVRDPDTYFRLNYEGETVVNLINKCAEILSDPTSTYNGAVKIEMYSELPIFMEGRSLFLISTMNNIIEKFRSMEDDYGIIPLPKLNSSQENYITLGNPWGPNGIAVPAYCDNPARTGLIMETMAYLSYETVRPAIYDIIIQQKVARDEESQQMLDIIYASSNFDLNVIHDFGGSGILLRDCACGNKQNFVSQYEAIKDKSDLALNKLVDAYLNLK